MTYATIFDFSTSTAHAKYVHIVWYVWRKDYAILLRPNLTGFVQRNSAR